MKKLLTTVTFLTVAATPAFAQAYDPDMGTGNVAPMASNQTGGGAYAQAPSNYGYAYPARRSARSNYAKHNLDYGSKMPRRNTNNN